MSNPLENCDFFVDNPSPGRRVCLIWNVNPQPWPHHLIPFPGEAPSLPHPASSGTTTEGSSQFHPLPFRTDPSAQAATGAAAAAAEEDDEDDEKNENAPMNVQARAGSTSSPLLSCESYSTVPGAHQSGKPAANEAMQKEKCRRGREEDQNETLPIVSGTAVADPLSSFSPHLTFPRGQQPKQPTASAKPEEAMRYDDYDNRMGLLVDAEPINGDSRGVLKLITHAGMKRKRTLESDGNVVSQQVENPETAMDRPTVVESDLILGQQKWQQACHVGSDAGSIPKIHATMKKPGIGSTEN